MNDQTDSTESHWFGHDRLRLDDGERSVDVTIGDSDHWDRSHLRRLRQSGDLPGMVPVIDSDFSADGKPFAVTPTIDASSLAELIDDGDLGWTSGAGITEAAARAAHEAHLRGLFHGAMSPDDVYVLDGDVAVGGIGLGLGGSPPAERAHWAAPEVRAGNEPTERSDVYSLGKILERSLGDDIDTVPRSIRRLIMWSSSDTPEARPPSAMEFASILAEGLGDQRETYGPAFIATGDVSDLAASATSAVTRHVPVIASAGTETEAEEEAEEDQDSASVGVGGLAAGAAAGVAVAGVAAAKLGDFGGSGGAGGSVPSDPIDDGFTVNPGDDVAPDATTDVVDAPAGDEVEDVDAGEEQPDDAEAEASTDTDADAETDDGAGGAEDFGEVNPEGDVADEFFSHGPAADEDETEEHPVPAAAETIDYDQPLVPARRRNWAGVVIAGILALGLAGIVYGLLTSGDDDEVATTEAATNTSEGTATTEATGTTEATTTTEATGTTAAPNTTEATGTTEAPSTTTDEGSATTATPTTAAPTTTEAPTTTAAPTTAAPTTAAPTTAAPTTAAPTTAAPTTAAPTTTAAAADEVATADPAQLPGQATGPITADEAAIQVLHGVPGAEVDVYANGEAIAVGFTAGSIAGPIDLPSGDYEIELFAAADPAAASSADRSDVALASQTVTATGDPASVVAHLDEDGEIAISGFAEDLTELDPGQTRLNVRHLMAAGPVDLAIDGEVVGTVEPGQEQSTEFAATSDPILIEVIGDDGDVITSAQVAVNEGELASMSAVGAPADGTGEIVIQRYSGLSTAPSAVPTGDSGLLDVGNDEVGVTVAYGLMAALALGGIAVAIGRRRRLS